MLPCSVLLGAAEPATASSLPSWLEFEEDADRLFNWMFVNHRLTDSDGRVGTLLDPSHQLVAGIYRMTFQTAEYWAAQGVTGFFYPYVQVRTDRSMLPGKKNNNMLTFNFSPPVDHFRSRCWCREAALSYPAPPQSIFLHHLPWIIDNRDPTRPVFFSANIF